VIWEAASATAAAGANRNIRRPVGDDARRRTGSGSLPSTDVANLDGINGIAHPQPSTNTRIGNPRATRTAPRRC
jgi:hypothetical protein